MPADTRRAVTAAPTILGGRSGRWHLAALVRPGQPTMVDVDLAVVDGTIDSLSECAGGCPSSDGRALVALPLLLNGHDHGRGHGMLAAGIPDGPLEEWIPRLAPHPDSPDQDELVAAAATAMLASGIGAAVLCVNPMGPDVDAEMRIAAEAVLRTGIRAALVYPFSDAGDSGVSRQRTAPGASAEELAGYFAAVEQLAADYDDPRIDVQFGPVGPQWVSETALAAIARQSAATGRRVHMHLLESVAQRQWADTVYPDGLLPFLLEIGLLGPRLGVAHGTQLTAAELDVLEGAGTGLSLNASSNLRLASGLSPIRAAVDVLSAVGFGLDGLALNDDHDGWTELRLARGLWQAQTHATVPADGLLDVATRGGRALLGHAAPAAPEPGVVADLQLVDITAHSHLLTRPDWTPADVVVAGTRPADVVQVWVAGRLVSGTDLPRKPRGGPR